MRPQDYQNAIEGYFKSLGCKIPDNQPIGKTIAAVINKSPNTVYRKMRGEIGLHMDEYISIVKHFNIELNILDNDKRTTRFSNMLNLESRAKQLEFMHYLQLWLKQESQLKGARSVSTFLPELPIYYFLKYPALSYFLSVYWLNRGTFQDRLQKDLSFSSETLFAYESAARSFEQMECKEFISYESVRRTLLRMEAGFKGGWYPKLKYTAMLDQMNELIQDYEQRITKGKRRTGEKLNVYLTESHYSNAIFQLSISDKPISTLTNTGSAIFMETQGRVYNESMKQHLENIVSNSILISQSSQKTRRDLFDHYRSEINEMRIKLENDKEAR